jgi:hypothetical protein
VDHGPRADLIRIAPCAEKCGDILRDPDEETDQRERHYKRHAAFVVVWAKHHGRARISALRTTLIKLVR